MSKAVVAGPDRGLGAALAARGFEVTRIDGLVTTERLREAGIEDADLFVLTDVSEATAISLVKELGDAKCVVYARESVPEFARGQLDLAIDPALMDAETVASEL